MSERIGKCVLVVAAVVAAAWCGSCDRAEGPGPVGSGARGERTVATSFFPTTTFAGWIGGGVVRVVCPCPPGEDPSWWRPSREALAAYQGASLVVLNGAGYERWSATAALPPSRVVDVSAGLAGGLLRFPGLRHNHGAGGAHTHEGTDGHTWMDPTQAEAQAGAIRDAMVRIWPADRAAFEAGYDGLRAELTKLDGRLAGLGERASAAALFASHPAYGYLARRYAWTIVDLDVPPDAELTAEQWGAVGEAMGGAVGRAGAKVVLFEEEPRAATRGRLRAWGAAAVVFDPCEKPGVGTYVERMNANVDRLEAALGGR